MMKKLKSKWDSLDDNIQKWATRLGAIATIIGVTVAGVTWGVTLIDQNLSEHIEERTGKLEDQLEELSGRVESQSRQAELQMTRIELISLIETYPTNALEIKRLAKEYFNKGGNHYAASVVQRWCDEYKYDCDILLSGKE